MILKPLGYLSGVTILSGIVMWIRMLSRKNYQFSNIELFFYIMTLSTLWIGGAFYIIYVHFKYGTEYNFKRKKMTNKEYWNQFWRWEVIRWVFIFIIILIFILFLIIKSKFTQ